MANATDVQGLCPFTNGRDLHKLLKDTKLVPASLCLGETHQRAGLCLLLYKSRIQPRFKTCRRLSRLAQHDNLSNLFHELVITKTGHGSTFHEIPPSPAPTIVQ